MKNQTARQSLLASTVISGAFLALSAGAAFAEDADKTQVEEVVVTGSRIARPNLEAPTAVQVIDAKTIDATGDINVGDIIRTLPSTGVSSLTATNSNFFTQSNGVTTVNLRNLGEDRTLVLVNGRRYVPGLPGSQVVDFNTIPTEFISRIDVVTGGASSVYGSDALAGVINIITQKNYQGFEVFGQAGETERNDGKRYRLGLKAGANFADGRGNVVTTLSYDNTDAIFAKNRGREMAVDGLGGAFFGEDTRNTFQPFYSGFIARGQALIPRPNAGSSLGRVINNGAVVPYVGATYGFNRQGTRQLYVPQESLKFSTQMNYDFNEHARWFTEVLYFRGKTHSQIEPTPLASSDIFRDPTTGAPQGATCSGSGAAEICKYGIAITSAIVPTALANAVRAANPGALDQNLVVGFQRRLVEVGNRENSSERTVARIVTGMEGDINEYMHYEASLNWGRTQESQLTQGSILKDRFLAATDAIIVNGQAVCRNELERARGCVPAFIFQEGGISKAALKYFAVQNQFDAFNEEFVANSFIRGKLPWELPAGAPQYAFGVEYRQEESRNTPDATIQQGLVSTNIAPETKGKFDVYELFGEARIPLLRDMPFAKALDLNLSARFSDYSTVGHTKAYAASLEYEPNDWLKFRGQYAYAVRAPNISELYAGRSQTFPTLTDPCSGLVLSGGQPAFLNNRSNGASGVNAASIGSSTAVACYSDPTLQARVARDGFFVLTQPELQGVGGFNEGNPGLGVETGKTWTGGVLFNPKWNDWWSPLSVSIDYFNIEITDAIQSFGRSLTLSRCYGGSTPSAQDPFYCQFIKRYAAGTANVGAIYEVNQQSFNIGELSTEGVDVQASYNLDLNRLHLGPERWDMGKVLFSGTYQYLLKYDTVAFPGAATSSAKGNIGVPVQRATVDMVYTRGPLQWSVQTQIIGKTCFFGTSCKKDDYINDLPIGVRLFTDTQVRYKVNDTATLYFGVDNVFDEYQRIGQGQGQPTGWTTQPDVFDGIGRRYYGGFRFRF